MTFLGKSAAEKTRPLSRAAVALALAALLLPGCDRKPTSPPSAPAPAGEAAALPELLLYCAAGIRPPVEELTQRFQTSHRVKIALDFAGSQVLLAKLKLSGRGDLYIPGDKEYMDQAARENLILSQQILCCFVPTILVQKGNPRNIRGIADLLQPGLKLGLGNAEACAIGQISKRIFARNDIAWDRVEKNLAFQSMTVNELGLQIQSGALDAVIVWDAIARYYQDHGTEVPIPAEQNILSTVSVGVLSTTRHKSWADRFVAFATSAEGQAVFRKHHYSVCPGPAGPDRHD
jgi:molybdate transport system substrate-binding protein